MLTDIFANRYAETPIWSMFGDRERRLLVQAFRILAEQLCPYWAGGKESGEGKAFWSVLHGSISMELGLTSLSPLAVAYRNSAGTLSTHVSTMVKVCEAWMLQLPAASEDVDRFVKERVSLIEIGFRMRGNDLAVKEREMKDEIARGKPHHGRRGIVLAGNWEDGVRARYEGRRNLFVMCVDELNSRLRQAGTDLNYHNGFIQRSTGDLTESIVEAPFWALLSDPMWANVDTDMKEAVDLRDNGGRDPAFYAARALESTIKIVSDKRAWTRGTERGAHNFIDNLASKEAGFIAPWESDALKRFFTEIRNPFGHGPGQGAMPRLSPEQTEWAIESCMSWIKSLIRRL